MEYVRSLLKKNSRNSRLVVPPEIRRRLGNEMLITRGPRKNLYLYSLDEWQRLVEGQKNHQVQRSLTSRCTEVTPDSQGRILISAEFQEYASLGTKVTIVSKPNKGFAEIYSQREEGQG